MSECCRGFLLTNAFLNSGKFSDIYDRLHRAARGRGIALDAYTNAELFTPEQRSALEGRYDFVLFWDKDVRLGRELEAMGLRLLNRPQAVDLCDSKILTYDRLIREDIPMPRTLPLPFTYDNIGYTDTSFLEELSQLLSLPFVIKEARGSFGAQVYLAGSISEAEAILATTGGREALAQEFISESRGRDIRINMVGDHMAAAMERFNDDDFRANITAGGSMRPYDPTDEELALARRVMKIMDLDFAGIDILFSHRGPLLCEVNSNPHFKSIYECTGVDVADEIMAYILAVL